MISSENDRIEGVVYIICMRRKMIEAEGWPSINDQINSQE